MKHMTFQLSECSCLHSFILFFLFNLNCAFTSLYILRLEHALLILYFLYYIVTEGDDIFQKEVFVTDMVPCRHGTQFVRTRYVRLVSIYSSVTSSLLRNSSSSHT